MRRGSIISCHILAATRVNRASYPAAVHQFRGDRYERHNSLPCSRPSAIDGVGNRPGLHGHVGLLWAGINAVVLQGAQIDLREKL
jgi:hypothetical protein